MNKFLILIIAAAAPLYFISCNDNPQDSISAPKEQGIYKITGYVSFNGAPVEGADIIITGAINWRTKSRSDGKFILEGLTKGEHIIRTEKFSEDSCLIYQQMNLVVVNDITNIGEFKLPMPVCLYELDSSGAENSIIKLKWSKSTDNDFEGYKVYRSDNPFINDNNAELVYSSIYNADTSYIEEKVRTGLRHYYRVYAYSSAHKGAATNLKYVDIPEFNLIDNHGFEITTDGEFPDAWEKLISGTPSFKYFSINTDIVHSGSRSLKIYYDDAHANPPDGHKPWGGLMQNISKTHLVKDREYALTLWTKSVIGSFHIRLVREGNLEDPLISYIVSDGSEWNEQRLTFTADQSDYYELWISVRPGFAVNGKVEGYIDDLKILR